MVPSLLLSGMCDLRVRREFNPSTFNPKSKNNPYNVLVHFFFQFFGVLRAAGW